MERYFKIVEIDRETFINATDEDLGSYTQTVIPMAEATYFITVGFTTYLRIITKQRQSISPTKSTECPPSPPTACGRVGIGLERETDMLKRQMAA